MLERDNGAPKIAKKKKGGGRGGKTISAGEIERERESENRLLMANTSNDVFLFSLPSIRSDG